MGKVRIVVQSWKHYWGELKHKRNEEGLTLIELMVVVVILGIISAVAIPAISSAINSAKVSTTESDLATLQQALQRYEIDHNNYPTTLAQLAEQTNAQGGTTGTSFGPYLDVTFPEKDAWSNPIYYAPNSTSKPTGYYLVSSGNQAALQTTVPASIVTGTSASFQIVAGGGTGVTDVTPESTSALTASLSLGSSYGWTQN